MGPTTRIQHKGQITIPTRVRRQAGLSEGDLVEFSYRRGEIVMTPKVVANRSKFPDADDEYTPAQRRLIDARLAESEEDFKQGRTYGPFRTADEMIAHMKSALKKHASDGKAKRRR
jgi:AbrB family looped-hinge helix DNA binding protein